MKVIGSVQAGVGGGNGFQGKEETVEGVMLDQEGEDGEGDEGCSGCGPGEVRGEPDGGLPKLHRGQDEEDEERLIEHFESKGGGGEAEEEPPCGALPANGVEQGGAGDEEEGGHDLFAFGGVVWTFYGVHEQE